MDGALYTGTSRRLVPLVAGDLLVDGLQDERGPVELQAGHEDVGGHEREERASRDGGARREAADRHPPEVERLVRPEHRSDQQEGGGEAVASGLVERGVAAGGRGRGHAHGGRRALGRRAEGTREEGGGHTLLSGAREELTFV